ncbi:hypothetical protein [Pasteurella testudinis]|uniref:hypothetical protein n=1 Tax=Pasteurella testudinis TaxID=761 RepID=UPI0014289098|nr:hypothetical protein [Pasteurella testudinis]
MQTWNGQGIIHLREILQSTEKFKVVQIGNIRFLEKRLPDGRGIRIELNGKFKGFVD